MTFRTRCLAVALTGMGLATTLRADFLVNGNFETYTGGHNGAPSQLNDTGTGGYSKLAGWTVGPGGSGTYGFLMDPTTHDTTGSYSPRFSNSFSLWGPGNGSSNGLTGSPTGGLYIALDSDPNYHGNGVSQTVSGLTVGQQYRVEFDWAAAQQSGFSGNTFDEVQVTFGGVTQTTATINLTNHGFSGWRHETFDFTANSATDTLTFLANGGPGGLPPFVLLDGVSLNEPTTASTPAPATALGLLAGLGCLGGVGVRRRFRATPAV